MKTNELIAYYLKKIFSDIPISLTNVDEIGTDEFYIFNLQASKPLFETKPDESSKYTISNLGDINPLLGTKPDKLGKYGTKLGDINQLLGIKPDESGKYTISNLGDINPLLGTKPDKLGKYGTKLGDINQLLGIKPDESGKYTISNLGDINPLLGTKPDKLGKFTAEMPRNIIDVNAITRYNELDKTVKELRLNVTTLKDKLTSSDDIIKTFKEELNNSQREKAELDVSLKKLNIEIDKFKDELINSNEEKTKLEDSFKELDKKRIDSLVVLGIFATLITIISVFSGVLSKNHDFYSLLALSFFLASFFFMVSRTLKLLIELKSDESNFLNKHKLHGFLFIAGIVCLVINYCQSRNKLYAQINDKNQITFNEQLGIRFNSKDTTFYFVNSEGKEIHKINGEKDYHFISQKDLNTIIKEALSLEMINYQRTIDSLQIQINILDKTKNNRKK